jgi:hypothetical protein
MSKTHAALLLEVLGVCSLTAGAFLVSVVAGLVVAGVALVLFGLAVERL